MALNLPRDPNQDVRTRRFLDLLSKEGWVMPSSLVNASLSTNAVTTSATYAYVSGMSFAVAKNEIWSAEFNLICTGTAAGMKFKVTGPSSPTSCVITVQGNTSGATATSVEKVALGSATATAYMAGAFTGVVCVKMSLSNGANSGTIQLQFAANTGGDTEIILAGSYLTARRA